MSGNEDNYLAYLFNADRIGFEPIAARILINYLDYASFVNFKRSCKFVRDYILQTGLERTKLRQKLERDWRVGKPVEKTLQVKLENDEDIDFVPPSCIKIFNNETSVLVGIGLHCDGIYFPKIVRFDAVTGEQTNTYSFRGHRARISAIEVIHDEVVVSGDENGKVIFWDLATTEVHLEKQLFGRITAIEFAHGHLVTSHFGLAFDVGCVTVRKFESPTAEGMPVVFSLFHEVLPICVMDFNQRCVFIVF